MPKPRQVAAVSAKEDGRSNTRNRKSQPDSGSTLLLGAEAPSHAEADRCVAQSIKRCQKLLHRGWDAWWGLLLEIVAIHRMLDALNRLQEFSAFLGEIGVSRPHGYALIKVHARFAGYEFANRFAPTALVKLATCSQDVIDKAERLVEKDGVFMTAERAGELIAELTPASRTPKAIKIARTGLPTVVLHPVKEGSEADLVRLMEAIQALLERFVDDEKEVSE